MRLGVFAFAVVYLHSTDLARIRANRFAAGPLRLFRLSPRDDEVTLLHFARLEQTTVGIDRAQAARKEQHPARFPIQPVDVPQELNPARARPEIPGSNGRDDGRLQIA